MICDADVCARAGWTVLDLAAACLDGGARFLQVRAKTSSGAQLLDMVEQIVRRAEGAGACVIVNDRADLARLAGAGGVHVGQDDLSPRDVRAIAGADAIVGLSTHTSDQIVCALGEPIDYLAVGPVFATASKETEYRPLGVHGVEVACTRVAGADRTGGSTLPVVAIGGITLDRAPEVIRAGARAVAVISDLLVTGDPAARVRDYLTRLHDHD